MKKIKAKNNSGQAITELAIMGTLIILGFSVVIMYGQRLELQNQAKMETFRKALYRAYERNSGVHYTSRNDKRMVSLFTGFGQGQETALGSSAAVSWQKGVPGHDKDGSETSFAFYEINGKILSDPVTGLPRIEKRVHGSDGSHQDVHTPVTVWKEVSTKKETIRSSIVRKESPSSINNTRSTDLTDIVSATYSAHLDSADDDKPWDNEVPYPVYKPENDTSFDAEYSAFYNTTNNRIEYRERGIGGETVHRERSWDTPKQ